jgi:hypothetical protein
MLLQIQLSVFFFQKPLLEFAGIQKEVVLFGYMDRVEIWDKAAYYEWADEVPGILRQCQIVCWGIRLYPVTQRKVMNGYHLPVLLTETVEALDIKPDGTYVDVTFGEVDIVV